MTEVSVLQGNVNLEVMGGRVYRDKGTPPKKGGQHRIQFYCYKTTLIPWVQGAEALITSPLPLTLEPPEPDHHLPFYFFPGFFTNGVLMDNNFVFSHGQIS